MIVFFLLIQAILQGIGISFYQRGRIGFQMAIERFRLDAQTCAYMWDPVFEGNSMDPPSMCPGKV